MKLVLKFLLSLLSLIGTLIADFCTVLFDTLQRKRGFESAFGYESDIAGMFNKGFVISTYRKLSRKKSFQNVMVAGPTGSGKTQRLLLKDLFTLKGCSVIINDPSRELYEYASGYLNQYFKIQTLNFGKSSQSSGYNILSRIRKASDVNKIAHILVASTLDKNGRGDAFWSIQAKAIIAVFIRLVMYQPKECRNMNNVLYCLNSFVATPEKVDAWLVKTGDKKLLLEYKAMVGIPEKTLQNILAGAKAALQLFEDEEIAKVTSHDSIDFEALRQKPTIIFLHNAISDMKYINILNGIFFEQMYGYVLEKLPTKKELDLFIILEECSSLYIPVLPTAISNTRKHRVGNLICVQSPSQLATFYQDDAVNIAGNCLTKIFLPGITSMETLKDLETYGGKSIHIDDKGTERIKPLITIDEIRLLPEDRTLILSSNNPLIKGRTSPCYKSWKYKEYMAIPPISLIGDIPDVPIRLLDDISEPIDNENPQS